ncbi:phage scaffolding protein [Rummeliibacillus stabekisii]|uniref:phage scaffolding protein n=1 Tax=Rummeliibacillus stabekisii TaxID=241244 RepID=UPI0020405AFE|nr:phage scaffolding protein [Rummeliibacillus stabekisii]MCM3316177.1 phage scaffolding protein [Rummeliibacillus stabekisii]
MNKEALLELGLTEEQADKVVTGFGHMVPKSRLDDKIQEVKDLKDQIKDRDTQLDDLSTKAAGNEDLQKQIQTLQELNQTTVADYEEKLKQKDFDFTLSEALRNAKAKNPKAVKALLNIEDIKLDEQKLIGLEDQLNALKESDAYLFESDKLKGKTPPLGGTPPKIATKAEFAKKSYEERIKLISENPNIMQELQ